MRAYGTLKVWNEGGGYGFIAVANRDEDVFVRISAFPNDGVRPQVGEKVSFDIVEYKKGSRGAKGTRRAERVERSGARVALRKREGDNQISKGGLIGKVVIWVIVLGVINLGYKVYQMQPKTDEWARDEGSQNTVGAVAAGISHPVPVAGLVVEDAETQAFSCDGRTRCSQMTSCSEAKYFLKNCPHTNLDGDGNGKPCEIQWCN